MAVYNRNNWDGWGTISQNAIKGDTEVADRIRSYY